jgi:6-pyruvoyltetrahydropterin/6-carboxytetrahydropterin synthase
MRVWREFTFEAAHWLPAVPTGHKCRRLHGHSYRVEVHVDGPVAADGMVMDFAEIKAAWIPLDDALDHRCLNDVITNPTSENLARFIWQQLDLPGLARVVVRETCTSGCEYGGDQ